MNLMFGKSHMCRDPGMKQVHWVLCEEILRITVSGGCCRLFHLPVLLININ